MDTHCVLKGRSALWLMLLTICLTCGFVRPALPPLRSSTTPRHLNSVNTANDTLRSSCPGNSQYQAGSYCCSQYTDCVSTQCAGQTVNIFACSGDSNNHITSCSCGSSSGASASQQPADIIQLNQNYFASLLGSNTYSQAAASQCLAGPHVTGIATQSSATPTCQLCTATYQIWMYRSPYCSVGFISPLNPNCPSAMGTAAWNPDGSWSSFRGILADGSEFTAQRTDASHSTITYGSCTYQFRLDAGLSKFLNHAFGMRVSCVVTMLAVGLALLLM